MGNKRGKYKPKKLNFSHVCERCKQEFCSGDVKGRFCIECKKPKPCKCGCGKIVRTPSREYGAGCQHRGKTYFDIYGPVKPKCGFGVGEFNVMANEASKSKQSIGLKNSYTPELLERRRYAKLLQIDNGFVYGKMKCISLSGEKYRSKLEVLFSDALFIRNLNYVYEPPAYKLPENEFGYKRKVVDFLIGEYIIEITGLAHSSWVIEFIRKINLLKTATDKIIVILTYPDKLELIRELVDGRTFIFDIFSVVEDENILLKLVNNNLI